MGAYADFKAKGVGIEHDENGKLIQQTGLDELDDEGNPKRRGP